MSKTFLQELENVQTIEPEDLGEGMFYFNISGIYFDTGNEEEVWVKSLLNFKKNNPGLKIVTITSVRRGTGLTWSGVTGVIRAYLVITEKK